MVKKFFLMVAVIAGIVFLTQSVAYSAELTEGWTYTITVKAINSTGTVVDLGKSTTAVAVNDGGKIKISFGFSGLPTRSSYNFLLVTIKDPTDTTVRQAIVPIAAGSGTTNLGASPMTYKQTEAMLSAMSTAVSDDPVLMLFGSILIRSGGDTIANNLGDLTAIGLRAIRGPNGNNTVGGFNFYLEAKVNDATKMAAFRSAIVTGLADYTGTLKQAVDAATSTDKRAEAASLLSKILIDAANTADFDLSYINAAMKAASDQQEDYLMDDATPMDEAAVSAMDCVMFTNYMKLNAERVRKKYSNALSTLDATPGQIARLDLAISDLNDTMVVAFQAFEEAFANEEGELDDTQINELFAGDDTDSGIQDNMDAGFNAFMADIAATDAEIGDEDQGMIKAMADNFAGITAGELVTMKANGMFKFWDMSGTQMNWPITMVVPVTWVATYHSGGLEYTRDDTGTLPIPDAMGWLSTRTNFVGMMPAALASLFGLREDIEIIQARKWVGISCASRDMTTAGYNKLSGGDKTIADDYETAGHLEIIAEEDDSITDDSGLYNDFAPLEDLSPYLTGKECQDIEEGFVDRLNLRKAAIDPEGTAGVTDAQKKALIDTAMMPDFH